MIFLNTFKKRIDELGRIVIPKEIRNNVKLNNFDELEMHIEDNKIIMKKTLGIENNKEKFENLLNLINELYSFKIFIFSKDTLVISNEVSVDNNVSIKNIEDKYNFNFYKDDIIVDSNLLGYMMVLSDFSLINYLKDILYIKEILLDIIT